MLKRITQLAALAVTIVSTTNALAADLPRKAPVYAPPPPPPYVWTGCYLGANVGAAWAHLDVTDVTSGASTSKTSNTGFAGGGQIGCDYQMGVWVVGIRNMFDGTSISGSRTFSDPAIFAGTGTVDTRVRWFDTLTARGGYLVQPNLLFYVQGGAAWTRAQATVFTAAGGAASASGNSNTGWTVGGGAEWMFVPHWSVFLEYNYMGFGTRSNAFTACGLGVCDVFSAKANVSDVLVGVNYRF